MSLGLGTRGSSNGRTSTQDYTNLLYTDSDSDGRIPDLKLPPVKGKKQKKKRGSSGYRPEETSCGVGSVMKACLLLVLLAAVAALSGVCFWTLVKISSLEDTVEKLQQSEAFTSNTASKFQAQLVSLNKSLIELRSGNGGIIALTNSVEQVKKKVKSFEDLSTEMNKVLESTKGSVSLEKQFNGITDVVAALRGDVLTASKRQKALEAKLDSLGKVTPSPSTDTSDGSQANALALSELSGEVKALNKTMIVTISSLKQRLDQQESKTSVLKDLINGSVAASPISGPALNQVLQDAIQNAMANVTTLGGSMEGLDQMLEQVKSMVQTVKAGQTDVVSKGDFLLFKEVISTEIQNVNESVATFNGELEEVYSHIAVLHSDIKNISNFMEEVASQLSEDTKVSPTGISGTPASSTEKESHQETTTKSGVEKSTTVGEGASEGEHSKSNTESENTGGDQDETVPREKPEKPVIQMENIDSLSKLHEAFVRVSPTLKPLNQDKLLAFLGEDELTQEQFDSIDEDKDGMFSETEIARAMGLQPRKR